MHAETSALDMLGLTLSDVEWVKKEDTWHKALAHV